MSKSEILRIDQSLARSRHITLERVIAQSPICRTYPIPIFFFCCCITVQLGSRVCRQLRDVLILIVLRQKQIERQRQERRDGKARFHDQGDGVVEAEERAVVACVCEDVGELYDVLLARFVMSVCLSVCRSVCLSVCLSVGLSARMSVRLVLLPPQDICKM
jgi:hypothetical protein